MAGKIILKAYEVGNNKVNVLTWEQLYNKYKNSLFKDLNYKSIWNFYQGKWQEIKETLVKKGQDVKHEDDIYYIVKSLGNAQFLVFAIGTGKKDTLQKIYLKALEEQGGNDSKATVQKETKSAPETSSQGSTKAINLADKSIDINDRFNAIINKQQVEGKLDEEDSYEFIRKCLTDDVINKFKADKKYFAQFLTEFAQTLKKYKAEFDKYNCDSLKSVELAKYLKEISKDSKDDPHYYEQVMGLDVA